MYRSDLPDLLITGVLVVTMAVLVWLGCWLVAGLEAVCILLRRSYRRRAA